MKIFSQISKKKLSISHKFKNCVKMVLALTKYVIVILKPQIMLHIYIYTQITPHTIV